jgi:hypothetical protein
MSKLILTGVLLLISSPAFAQAPGSTPFPLGPPAGEPALATPTGSEVSVSVGSYNYVEPGSPSISIHGAKIGAEYSGTVRLDERRRWFGRAEARGVLGNVAYDGACSPWLIAPNSSSPNGYELDTGDYSPCGETGDKDWYIEARGLIGKDFIGQQWAWSPSTGLGLRHLSNGTTGIRGYRTDNYLYVPFGLTARTKVTPHNTLSFTVEYDRLLHGWQTTRDSALGGGDVPATPSAPAFTIDGFTDISFSQHSGWALRASAKYQLTPRWSVEPSYIHWNVSDSPVNDETATFAVNGISAQEQFGAYEPLNHTNEFAVKLGFTF